MPHVLADRVPLGGVVSQIVSSNGQEVDGPGQGGVFVDGFIPAKDGRVYPLGGGRLAKGDELVGREARGNHGGQGGRELRHDAMEDKALAPSRVDGLREGGRAFRACNEVQGVAQFVGQGIVDAAQLFLHLLYLFRA